MAETFWLALAPAWAGGLVLSWALEALLRPPVQPPWRRPAWTLLLHAGVWTLLFALELALFRRPYFGAINVLAIEAVLVLVSAAKARVLREPFVYSDFEYFTDALRHPRLYLPFLGWPAALLLACGYGLALWAGLALEPSATGARTAAWAAHAAPAPFWGATLALAAAGAALAVLAGHRDAGLTYEADQDLRRLGLVATLWLYGRAERQPWTPAMRSGPFGAAPAAAGAGPLPHLVSVQSESFFDARRVFGTLKPEVLAGLDALRAEALEHGQLEVAAWGANTVRTEFAFLTGLAASVLGVHRYNPYRRLRQPQPSLASHLRQRGYRTVCVHPFHASFYGRDRVMPWLGFDEFVHLDAFADAPRAGPYVADAALARYVAERLAGQGSQPLYVHVITMENHGPLHWESVDAADAAAVLDGPLAPGCADLVAYARHLRNADAMFTGLAAAMRGLSRPAGLCVYGDHVPIMAEVYRRLGEPDGRTDYLIWQAGGQGGAAPGLRRVDELAQVFLRHMGLAPPG
ncbi:Phosphoglycerol transferase and related proteins, alkaline phosphatase superfamily [Mycobacteroides abscessus subsp. abscessus]|nr:Phosphoglycerol transferase and related proteins, alkaline phosphatase superfamily [Mycobacteroides abscessus subsp. abscessus]